MCREVGRLDRTSCADVSGHIPACLQAGSPGIWAARRPVVQERAGRQREGRGTRTRDLRLTTSRKRRGNAGEGTSKVAV